MPGWDAHSWGYHGDDGGRFHGDGAAVARDPPFGRGDVVGCGVDRGAREVFFTRNGAYLGGLALARRELGEALFPAVGLDHADAVMANFGAEPFAYDLSAHEGTRMGRAALARALRGAPAELLPAAC